MRYLLLSLFLAVTAQAADYRQFVKDTMPKVVTIEVSGVGEVYESIFDTAPTHKQVTYTGAGSFITGDGHILTCHHLFEDKLEDRVIVAISSSGYKYRAVLLSDDKEHDLALLKIFPLGPVPFFVLGEEPTKGQEVLAFGAPLAISHSMSVGYVENNDVSERHLVLHSAGLNPGNSGGPLVNTTGQIVGVNVQALLINPITPGEGMGEAVSMHDIRLFLGL